MLIHLKVLVKNMIVKTVHFIFRTHAMLSFGKSKVLCFLRQGFAKIMHCYV